MAFGRNLLAFVVALGLCAVTTFAQVDADTWNVNKLSFERGRPFFDPTGGISNPDIVVVDSPGAKSRKLVAGVSPAWSPDGQKIAYCIREGSGFGQIYVINADGTGKAALTNVRGGGCDPQWAPDGERLIFTALGFTLPKLVITSKTGEPIAVLDDGFGAHWSPDGKQIAFCRTVGHATTSIMVVNSDGTGMRKLVDDTSQVIEAAWMPDGRSVVFSSKRDRKTSAIYRVNMDGSAVSIFAEDKNMDLYFPVPSPDGNQLIVDGYPKRSGDSNVILLNVVTGQQSIVARGVHPAVYWARNPNP